ncbi:DMT family transporter [Shewanella surugensis]|uniref:DMT family transporter n=1 Tax=Shewanella surugensis TaxID=212020 RepID=A0ABT0LBN1_9GAMM|nr:DMT family transporter [Shewanella surugensis]MCL1125096.1 DMT family transporter [Shewanella surugensis]
MLFYIVIALLNGVVMGCSRALNGQLSMQAGPLKASVCNHLVGFILLSFLLIIWSVFQSETELLIVSAPWYLYLGGFIGALYVALNSFILSQIGAANTALLVISGQMITGIFLEHESMALNNFLANIVGVILIGIGIYFSQLNSFKLIKQK